MRVQVCSVNLTNEEYDLHLEKLSSMVEDQQWVGDRSRDGVFGKLTTHNSCMLHMFQVTFKASAEETRQLGIVLSQGPEPLNSTS